MIIVQKSFQMKYYIISQTFKYGFLVSKRMIDQDEFQHMRKELGEEARIREEIILLSRDIILSSKRAIYSVHRNQMDTSLAVINDMKKKIEKLKKIDTPLDTNMASVAYQEYVEAATLYHYAKTGKLLKRSQLKMKTQDYLLGLCDLTGELVRRAVNSVIGKNYGEAEKIKELVTLIYGEFLKFDFRNGELRKKSDSIKWNLSKIEQVMYDVSLKEMD